jgi:hypothetical protein
MDNAIVFGSHQHLLGVLRRVAPESDQNDVAVIMVTPGMLHHAGPFRLHVDLAERFAERGIASLRFDLSGIGESFGVGTGGRSIDRAANEIRQAIDWLVEHTAARRVILFGLCSGADDSIHAALSDDRVAGVLAMDGCGFPTPAFYKYRFRKHVLPRLIRPRKWVSLLMRTFRIGQATGGTLSPGIDVREFPDRDEQVRQLQQLSDRGVRMHFAYTGGIGDYYNHAEQFGEMFPELIHDTNVTSRFFGSMDHVAMLLEDRRELVCHLCDQADQMLVAMQASKPETPASLPAMFPSGMFGLVPTSPPVTR